MVAFFQADHVDPEHETGWSVLVTGVASTVDDPEAAGLSSLALRPWTGGGADHWVRIPTTMMRGRRITTRDAPPVGGDQRR